MPILKDQAYLTFTINELFLCNARKGWTEYQPMVVAATSFIHGNHVVTVPAVVGPSLLAQPGQQLPQGLLLNDIVVAGPNPYRGGPLTVNILLYRVKHTDHASDLLRLVEGVSKAIGPSADFGLLSKIGATLLESLEKLAGLSDTEPVMAQRFSLSPVGPAGFKTFYAALIGAEAHRRPASLSTKDVYDWIKAWRPCGSPPQIMFSTASRPKHVELTKAHYHFIRFMSEH